jgi:hydroxymethylbilane synthase
MTSSPLITPQKPLRIGTRRSPLAMAQAQMAASAIRSHYGLADGCVTLVPMLASGDIIQDRPLSEIGGKALWTKELERALLDSEIDIAVHSMKDVETIRPPEFCIAAMLPRADARDRLIGAASLAALPVGAIIGTSSPRRAAQIRAIRSDVVTASIRGNVATRLGKIEIGEFDATLLAAAGLDRLSMPDTGVVIEIADMLPAASQGAIGIETLAVRDDLLTMLAAINHEATYNCVMAERAFLEALGGSCHSPVAALAVMDGDQIWLRGEILLEDGSERQSGEMRFVPADIHAPELLADDLLERASDTLKMLFAPC